ncbi:sigma factor-like helix-turn-helix DNA-binding protein [Kitasatospora sp. GAS204B]|uniref:sigma factor-like helix-turn-helix DNA-binding protein n=1 Tax=unclassified Kitasatospora TaxID=2633591 RepID=UPI0024751ACC|nr:sigma factor-like helix-turn-helix DNA-binding protein [Kitasatospora sp. GAS204B]MDH6120595.1 DNA-directed RNA polymerase specialized sigma24 family protein [Kitasatospora sp. GAS204B]
MRQNSSLAAASPSTSANYQKLYERSYDELLQQTFLLTAGHRRGAERATRQALGSAWNRWSELAAEPDPARWLRTRAFATALTPWYPLGPRSRHRTPPLDSALTAHDLELLTALRRLSRARRQVVVLHDALGLAAAEIAVEVEASAAAVGHRLHAAHLDLVRAVPALVGPDPAAPDFAPRLGGLLYQAAVRGCPSGAEPRQADLRCRAAARARALALPAGAALLVLATTASITGTLDGHGPSAWFNPRPVPAPLCTGTANGSAGPATPAGTPGIRSFWCGPGKTPHPGPANRSGVRQQTLLTERQPLISSRARRAVSDGVLPTLTPAASRASFFA